MRTSLLSCLLALFFVTLGLVACTPLAPAANPLFASADARATLKVVELQEHATLQALAATQSAQQALAFQATLSAAHTQEAIHQTQQAHFFQVTQTAQAHLLQQTVAAQLAATQAAQMTQTAAAFQTAQAFVPSATAAQAQMNAIVRADREAQLRANWQEFIIPVQTLLPTLLGFTVLIGLVLGGFLLYPQMRSMFEAVEMRMRTQRDAHGEVTLILNRQHEVHTLLPGRSAGHGLRNTNQGILVDRSADGPQWQDRVSSREQIIRALQALATSAEGQIPRKQIARQLMQGSLAQENHPRTFSPGEIRILPPTHPRVQSILADVEPRLLDDTLTEAPSLEEPYIEGVWQEAPSRRYA